MIFNRYALYYCPPADADWARFCARWLGWDMIDGVDLAHPDLPVPISEITQAPRKYGLHATLKPPFQLAAGTTQNDLQNACTELAAHQQSVQMPLLTLTRLGRFLALCPERQSNALNDLAANCVSDLDKFRAPMTDIELTRRRGAGLSNLREQNLLRWGYPHVMDLFRFHITLTGRLPKNTLTEVETILKNALTPLLSDVIIISDLALVGEDDHGRFHLIQRFALTG